MTGRITLPSKYASETILAAFDFTSNLAIGETISTQVCTCAVWSGTDASPSSVISGSATASGTVVSQKLTGGVLGVMYNVTCTITTSAGQTLALQGLLAIIPTVI